MGGSASADGPWSVIRDHKREMLLVLSGPSGAGKSSLIDAFLADRSEFVRSISATTRAPRGAEQDGVDYHFIDDDTFKSWVAEERFLEHAQVFGQHSYGTPRHFIEQQFADERSVIMDIDVQGARQIRAAMADAVTVFVAPPSRDELARRLRGRGTDDDQAVSRRLHKAEDEVSCWAEYDYLIINDDLDSALRKLRSVVAAERMRTPSA
ncbi:MAG: guanylate kinase [Planctomycetota bacterium]|jgi:guanylate kinase|nr:guanylate kinase [Planctomycetota bacterium]